MEGSSQATHLLAWLARGMGPDLHWFPEDVSATRLGSVLVGMANTAGGNVVIGVAPRSGQIQGLTDPQAAIDCVFQAALLSDPTLVLPIPRLVQINQSQVLVVAVPPGLPNVYSIEGRYLGREGTQTNPLPARRLRQLLVERGIVQVEALVPPNATMQDLDPEKIEAYLHAIGIPAGEKAEEVLFRRGCLKRQDGEYLPTHAAILLFGREPQQWLPNATILATKFPGVAFADRYVKDDIAGTLPEQLYRAEAFAQANMQTVVRLVGMTHRETSEYPPDAVRELLVNAVAHRDYNQQGDNIHFNIFSDRIEVHSPGGLPGPVTLDNLLEARFSRNPVIVQVLADLGFVERLGYGLDRVVTSMRQNGMRLPRFEETAGSFRVTLFGELPETDALDLSSYQHLDLNQRQQMAVGYIARHRRITNRDYQDLCPDVHSETLRRDLVDLVNRGILIKVGDKRATYYIIK